jgi:hypothetical protein
MTRGCELKQAHSRCPSHKQNCIIFGNDYIVFLKNNAVLIQPLRNTIDSRMRVKASTYSNSQKFLTISKQPFF